MPRATSLLTAAPEAWLVSECAPEYLGETFGMAYAYDPVVAMAAGQLAGWSAQQRGPTGPFQLSPLFLILGALVVAIFWKENRASRTTTDAEQSIQDAIRVIRQDYRILCLGGVQALFEGAMYIFVMQWPPTMNRAIQQTFGASTVTPYGTLFSCFMACCLLGSTFFGQLAKMNVPTEKLTLAMLAVATTSMSLAAWQRSRSGPWPASGTWATRSTPSSRRPSKRV